LKHLGQWKAIPLNKGLYEFAFSPQEDIQRALVVGIWNYLLAFFMFFLRQKILSWLPWNSHKLNIMFTFMVFLKSFDSWKWFSQ